MRSMKFRILAAAAVVCSVATFAAQAAITITGTRVVYPAQNREVNVRLNNVDSRPVLVQPWLDDGDAAAILGAAQRAGQAGDARLRRPKAARTRKGAASAAPFAFRGTRSAVA